MPKPITRTSAGKPTRRDHPQTLATDPREQALRVRSFCSCVRRCSGFGGRNDFQGFFTHDLSSDCLLLICVARDGCAQVVFHRAELLQHRVRWKPPKRRRAQFPSSPRRGSPTGRAKALPPAAGTSRFARRSFGSARRSIRPLSASRSRRRVSVIGCRSSRSAEFRLFETLVAINAHQDRPLGAGDAELPGLSGRHRSSAGALRP